MDLNIKNFLDKFRNNDKFFLNLPVFWTVSIIGVTMNDINTVLSENGEKWKANTSSMDMMDGGNILVAQEINLPLESAKFDPYTVSSNTGGYLPGYGMASRSNFLSDRQISVNFLETEMDIDQNFFRPWIIALGIKGLIEYGPNLKATMIVKQYSNDGRLIKGFRFNKVFPTVVEGYKLNYDNTDMLIRSVTFACDTYEQLDRGPTAIQPMTVPPLDTGFGNI